MIKIISEEIQSVIELKASENNWNIEYIRYLTDHPDDHYLLVTLCYNESKNEYCVHLFNTTLDNNRGGFVEGFYSKNYEVAKEKFDNKK